jgi:DNA-dependent protein kinase catalytic subunit
VFRSLFQVHQRSACSDATVSCSQELSYLALHQRSCLRFKDELLAACLQLVLSVPKQFVRIAELVPALQMALRIGLSYNPLAVIGLNAIEYWLQTVPADVTPELGNILPFLADYLTVKSSDSANARGLVDTKAPAVEEKELPLTSAEELSQKGKPTKKKSTIDELKPVDKNADPLLDLQYRIIRLLGRIGGHNANIIKWQGTEVGMAIDPTLRIKFTLPFADLKPEMMLGEKINQQKFRCYQVPTSL